MIVATALTPGFAAAEGPTGWQVDLSAPNSGSSNVITEGGQVRLGTEANRAASAGSTAPTGMAIYGPHRLSELANTFTVTMTADGDAAVDVRGIEADGDWTEWTEVHPDAPVVLAAATPVVQARVVLASADSRVHGLTLRPAMTSAPSRSVAEQSYRVFATREGLVGGTTANGHVIVPRDHFVALPSRRGLSGKGTGDYTVRVCAENGRCEWAPVWDVGPWNTKDDYWNPSPERQMWQDLAQGRPQAQAAKQDGYNGGKDQFGRTVRNPAAIDLADGTFWDGLRLTDNSWVTVTYLWSGSGPAAVVATGGVVLNVRTGPSSATAIVGGAANHARVPVMCRAAGEMVTGSQGTTDVWYRVAADKYISGAWVTGVGDVAVC